MGSEPAWGWLEPPSGEDAPPAPFSQGRCFCLRVQLVPLPACRRARRPGLGEAAAAELWDWLSADAFPLAYGSSARLELPAAPLSPWQLSSVVPVEERESILPPSRPPALLPTPSSPACLPPSSVIPARCGSSVHPAWGPVPAPSRHGLPGAPWALVGSLTRAHGGLPGEPSSGCHFAPRPLPLVGFLKGNFLLLLKHVTAVGRVY